MAGPDVVGLQVRGRGQRTARCAAIAQECGVAGMPPMGDARL
ncbi:hypothetical protein XCR_1792 [Xanthomonas campestris pv. raphani 756C]|nr:hypothetical protein XCR_1792 [Xanthomonas campestris pv. raphani 756C]